MKIRIKNYLIFISLFVIFTAQAQNVGLNVGDLVKPFSAKSDNGDIWESTDVIGKKNLVVYFYPAAMTGGCTKQACAYRDSKDELSSLDAEVVGISGDEVKNLELFKSVHNLNFTLLSDADGNIANEFGVPVRKGEKSIEREVSGVQHILSRDVTTARWTFIIDKKGKLVYKSTKVNAAEDSKAVVE
ncbi:MAG: peroxiredoxin, partial [Bacteroidales bacterium]|nr:peroxiredoxin [Bacteroidales bacterium]